MDVLVHKSMVELEGGSDVRVLAKTLVVVKDPAEVTEAHPESKVWEELNLQNKGL